MLHDYVAEGGMRRLVPFIVSAIGTLGLSLAILYVAAVAVAFAPGYAWVTDFLVGPSDIAFSYMFLLAAIPYVLLTLHLYLRTALGGWMLDRGWVDEALEYVRARTDSGMLRSRREAQTHRLVLARALIATGDYDSARPWLAAEHYTKSSKAQRFALARWRMEIALRCEDLVAAREASESAGEGSPRSPDAAALSACRAELCARQRDRPGYDEAVKASRWAGQHPRLAHAEAIAALRFGELDNSELASRLAAAQPALDREVSGRAPEIAALVALLQRDPHKLPSKNTGDARARFVVETIRKLLLQDE